MARIPDDQEFARRWRAKSASERRVIVRSVNRGLVVENRRDAALAVVLARRQQRFWRAAWVLGPLLSLLVGWLLVRDGGLVPILANAVLGTAVLAGMSLWFLRRARRAESLNTEHATGRKR